MNNKDYLVYTYRKKNFAHWLDTLNSNSLKILDVGGRIQPYRKLLTNRVILYLAIDPILEGLVDIVAVGESLPFSSGVFDMVFCTQVLGYVEQPFYVIEEIYRVLKSGGVLFLSAPAFFPQHHDERWRILPEAYKVLLRKFSSFEIRPEGHSAAGLFRTMNVCIYAQVKNGILKRLISNTLIPIFNIAGISLERVFCRSEMITSNYSVFAVK